MKTVMIDATYLKAHRRVTSLRSTKGIRRSAGPPDRSDRVAQFCAWLEHLGERSIIRAMPNTPAQVGLGITAIIGNVHARADDLAVASALFSMVGQVVLLETEAQIDMVAAISGSGPASQALSKLVCRAVRAAYDRSIELGT